MQDMKSESIRKGEKKMRKILSLVIALCLIWSCCLAEGTADAADNPGERPSLWNGGETHTIEKKAMTMYIYSLESQWPEDFPVYFTDGVADLPWLDVQDYADFLGISLSAKEGKEEVSDIAVMVDEAQKTVTWLRRDSDLVIFDFAQQQITWSDYQGFSRREGRPYMDMMLQGFAGVESEGKPGIIRTGAVRERLGKPVTLDLKKHGIPMLAQDGLYLVPLQTLSAFFLSPENLAMYCNQECLILTSPSAFIQEMVALQSVTAEMDMEALMGLQGLSKEEQEAKAMEMLQQALASREKPTVYNTYMSGPKGERSVALTDYGLHELAMELDYLYGLKEAHDIDDFMLYFLETGLLSGLNSTNPEEADNALLELLNIWLDDGHSLFYSGSYLSESRLVEGEYGFSKSARSALTQRMVGIRRQALGNIVPDYTEIGDTAFVTLDSFSLTNTDYYTADLENMPGDTIASVIKAHRQITRENSPIRNVVLDLSLNGGGDSPAAVFLLSWILGDAHLSLKSTFSGAESTSEYQADVNLDHVFDEQDTLAGRGLRLFCLTSPVSFSCGNLVPWAFKEDGSVKLLGSTTGGGSCIMLPMTTAWGTSYVTSSPNRLSFLKNGAYYDVDKGVDPDYVISSYERYYDREALVEYINSLY